MKSRQTKGQPGLLSGNIRTMPASFYRSVDQYELSLEKIFARSWQFLGTQESLQAESATAENKPSPSLTEPVSLTEPAPRPEDETCLVPLTLLEGSLNEPLLLVKGKNDLSILSNVCTHRGSLLTEKACRLSASVSSMRCRYHGRRFALDGTCLSAPGFEEAQRFPGPADNLPRAAMSKLGPFIFAGIEPLYSLADLLGDIPERLSFLPLEKFKFAPELSSDYFIDAHWALYVDNYLEGLHVPFVHPSLGVLLDTKAYRTELQKMGNLQVGVASRPQDAFVLPPQSPDYGQLIAAYYYWLFPNLMLNFYPWGLSVNIVMPLGHNRTRVRFLTYVWKEELFGNYSVPEIKQTELEDEAVVHLVQKGIQSRLYNSGRYSPTWEQGVYQFHKLIKTFLAGS